jgi:hypothetical protein
MIRYIKLVVGRIVYFTLFTWAFCLLVDLFYPLNITEYMLGVIFVVAAITAIVITEPY